MNWGDADEVRAYHRTKEKLRRLAWIEKLGGKCALCGSIERLEFDHIDRTKKERHISQMWTKSDATLWAELSKCQVLCHECHVKKTRSEIQHASHGTNASYTSKSNPCRCPECKAAHAASNIAWWQRKKNGELS